MVDGSSMPPFMQLSSNEPLVPKSQAHGQNFNSNRHFCDNNTAKSVIEPISIAHNKLFNTISTRQRYTEPMGNQSHGGVSICGRETLNPVYKCKCLPTPWNVRSQTYRELTTVASMGSLRCSKAR